MSAQRLRSYIEERALPAEVLEFSVSCHSVAQAAEAAGVTRKDFVKSICLVAGDRLIVAVVKGEDRASATRVGKLLGVERPRPATPEEMLERTGYPCGGTPPFGFEAEFLIDERVAACQQLYGGGGSEQALVRFSPAALNGVVARVRS